MCISGAKLGRWKSELHDSDLVYNTSFEFKDAVLGKPRMYFPKNPNDEGSSDFSFEPFPISKGREIFYAGQHEDNAVFDAIIFSDLAPFAGWSSKPYTICYREDVSQELKNLLDELFHNGKEIIE